MDAWIDALTESAVMRAGDGRMLRFAVSALLDATVGVVAGALLLAAVAGVKRVWPRRTTGA